MTRFLAIGIGCRKGVSGEAVAALVRQAIAAAPPLPEKPVERRASFDALCGERVGVRGGAAIDPDLRVPSSGPSGHLLPQAREGRDPPLPLAGEGLGVRVSPPLHLFTLADKSAEPGLILAAAILGAPLTGLPLGALEAQAPRILTRSPAARARFGIDSVAEAAGLAGAGPGGALLGPRLAADGVTCAVALSADVA